MRGDNVCGKAICRSRRLFWICSRKYLPNVFAGISRQRNCARRDVDMSDQKPPSPKSDELAKQLKDSLAQRRPRTWKPVLAALAASVLLLALLAWWRYPRPKPGPLQVMALDVVCNSEETPHARAQLFAGPDDKTLRGLSGQTIVFHEQPLLLKPGEKPREI